MYHQFVRSSTASLQTMTSKLNQTLKDFQQHPQINEQEDWFKLQQEYNRITIQKTIHNEKFGSYLFVLSNDRILRYDEKLEIFEEIKSKSIRYNELMNVSLQDLGEVERYCVLTGKGVEMWSLERKMQEIGQQKAEEIINVQENIETKDKKEGMKEEKNQITLTHKVQLNTIFPKVDSVSFMDIIKNNPVKEQLFGDIQHSLQPRLRQASASIVKDSHMTMKNEKNELEVKEAFLVIRFLLSTEDNYRLAVFRLKVTKADDMNDEQKEILRMTPIRFSTDSISILLALTTVEVPFHSQTQLQTIDPDQITESSSAYSKYYTIFSCDRQFVKTNNTSNLVKCFSIYFTTQTFNGSIELGNESRNIVFEYRLGVTEDDVLEVNYSDWASPIFVYPEKLVMCPAKVYYLPFIGLTGLLCFIDLEKTFLLTQQKEKENTTKNQVIQPYSYKFNIVSVHQGNKVEFSQVQCRIMGNNTEEQESNAQNHSLPFKNVLNEQNRTWQTVLNEQISYKKLLLLDPVQKYAILLVNIKSIKIRNDLVVVKGSSKMPKLKIQTKIVVINLRENLPGSVSKISAEYSLQGTFGQSVHDLQFKTSGEMVSENFPSGQNFTIHSEPIVAENSLNRQKILSIINVRRDEEIKEKLKQKKKSLYEEVKMIPKAQLYCQMLGSLMGEQTEGMESFFGNVIATLKG